MLCSGSGDYLVIKHTGRYTFTDTLLFDIAEANAEVDANLLRALLVQSANTDAIKACLDIAEAEANAEVDLVPQLRLY